MNLLKKGGEKEKPSEYLAHLSTLLTHLVSFKTS